MSCSKDAGKKDIENTETRIRKSVKTHDDNANGSYLRQSAIEIREITNFYYNESDLLDSFHVFYDSLQQVLTRSLKATYTDSNMILVEEFDRGKTHFNEYHYNDKRQLTKVRSTVQPDLSKGLFINYINDKIVEINLVLDKIVVLNNFLYDSRDNLLQYTIKDDDGTLYLVKYKFDEVKKIPKQMDIKFGVVDLLHWYAGGVNVLELLGLNTGVGNTNWIMERTESVMSTDELKRSYKFSYTDNIQNQITNKNIILNDTISVFYQYYY
jgi:hypothetical protein